MRIEVLAEHHLKFLSLKGGCTTSSESTHAKMPHCWKSRVVAKLIAMSNFMSFLIYDNFQGVAGVVFGHLQKSS